MDNEEVIIDVKVEGLAEAIQNLQALKNERKELNKVVLEGGEGQDEAAQKLAATDVAIKQQESALKSLKTAASLTQAENSKLNDSLDGQRSQLSLLKNQYTALTKAERESAAGQELRDKIKGLNDEVKDAEKGFGDFGRDVANYPNQLNAAANSIAGMKSQLADLNDKLSKLDIDSTEFKDTKKTIDSLSLAVDQASGKVDEFGNREPKNIAKKNFEDTMVTVSILSSSINALSSAFSEDEDVQKSLQKATQALAISQSIANVVKEKGAIIDTVTLVREKALAASKWVLITVTKVFELASKKAWAAATLGVSLLIAGVIALTSDFQAIIGAVKEFFGITNKFAETEKQINNLSRALDNYDDRTNRVADRLKAEGKTEQELLNFKKRRYEEELKLNQDRYNKLKSLTRDLTDEEKEMKAESAEFIKNQNIKRYEFETEQISITNKAKEKAADDDQKRIEDQTKANQDAAAKRIEEQKRLNDSINALNKALEDKALENIEEGLQRDLAARELAGKREIEELKNRAVKTQAERDKIAQLVKISEEQTAKDLQAIRDKNAQEELKRSFDAETERINLVLETAAKGNEDYFNLRVTAAERLRDKELENAKLTEQERVNIITRYENVISGIRSEQEQQSFERQKMAMQNLVNQRLNDLKNSLASEVEVRKYYEQLANDELANIKREQFETEEAYNAAIIASKQKVIDASADVKAAELDQTMTILGSAEQVFGAMGDLIGQFAEDNEQLASFQKAFSLFSIALNTGQAIAAGISGAMTLPFPGNLAAIAGTIATVMANIGSAVSLVKKQKEPKLGSSGGSSSISLSAAASAANTATLSANTASSQNGGSTENAMMAAETAAKNGAASQKVVLDYSEFTTFKTNVEIKESEAKI